MKFRAHISYYGTKYIGWQRQGKHGVDIGHQTVQELVEKALKHAISSPQNINVTSVSRTDTGTHALWQYGTFRLDELQQDDLPRVKSRMNDFLPEDIVVHGITQMHGAHEHMKTVSEFKKYYFFVEQNDRPSLEMYPFSFFIKKKLNIHHLQEALALLEGTHDYRGFSTGLKGEKYTTRTILSAKVTPCRSINTSLDPFSTRIHDVIPSEEICAESGSLMHGSRYFLCFEFIGNGFLRHMIRRIMGSMRFIGEGSRPSSFINDVLEQRANSGPAAPSRALWLGKVWMTNEEWESDKQSVGDEVFRRSLLVERKEDKKSRMMLATGSHTTTNTNTTTSSSSITQKDYSS